MKTHEKYLTLNEKVQNNLKKPITGTIQLETVLKQLGKIAEKPFWTMQDNGIEWDDYKKQLLEDLTDLKTLVDNCYDFTKKNK